MNIGYFTVEEINLIAMYLGNTRADTIMQITAALPFIDDKEVYAIAENAIRKLAKLEEQEYAEYSFIPADETEGEE